MEWSDVSLREKLHLTWQQRVVWPKEKWMWLRHFSISEWRFRYRNAKTVWYWENGPEENWDSDRYDFNPNLDVPSFLDKES